MKLDPTTGEFFQVKLSLVQVSRTGLTLIGAPGLASLVAGLLALTFVSAS